MIKKRLSITKVTLLEKQLANYQKRYEELKETLEVKHKRDYLAIEIETGDYFIGKTIEKVRQIQSF